MMADEQHAEIVKNDTTPPSWSVELLNSDHDGGVDVTLFFGPDAEFRAREYAAWKYTVKGELEAA